MNNFLPFRPRKPPTDFEPQMLTVAAALHVKAANTPMAVHTESLLASALGIASIFNDAGRYEQLLAWAQCLSTHARAHLFSEIDRLTERCVVDRPDGGTYEAMLLSIPVTVVTDHATSDIDGAAYELLRTSMRRHGLLDPTAEVVIMPWLTRAPAEHANPIRRMSLLHSLIGSLEIGETPEYERLAQDCRPTEAPQVITERVVSVRFLTAALFTSSDVREFGDRLWHDPAYQDKAEAWLDEVSQLLTASGNYEFAQAGLPTSQSEADMEGNLQRAGTEISLFIGDSARDSKHPPAAQCKVVTRPERHEGVKTHLHVRYMHQDETLKAIRVALPVSTSAEHIGLIGHTIAGAVYCTAQDTGVGEIQDLDL